MSDYDARRAELAEWCLATLSEVRRRVGHDEVHDDVTFVDCREIASELVDRLMDLGYFQEAPKINISACTNARIAVGILYKWYGILTSKVDIGEKAFSIDASLKPLQSDRRPDGPFPPNGFASDGKTGTISRPKVWKLINALWNAPNRTLDFEDIAEPVWGDHEATVESSMVSSLRRDANRFFDKHAMPFKVKTIGSFVSLLDFPE